MSRSYRARYIVTPEGVREGAAITLDDERIASIGPPPDDCHDLGQVALIPGLVNAHSHAFQRLLRGRTEWLDPERLEADFWSWRTRMYRAANALTAGQIYAVSSMAFLEMALAGITAVGEFHYLHNQPGGAPHVAPNELASVVIAAAVDVGIRITLLRVAYARGGSDRALSARQRRFETPHLSAFLGDVAALNRANKDPLVTVGVAPHSVRAVPREWLEGLADTGLPTHVHACEQRQEVVECIAEYGVGPIELIDQAGLLKANTTLIHATHLAGEDVARIAASGAVVCACPTTERNLGDGFLPASALFEARVPICLGSDSHAEIDPFGEARLVEYHERLRHERRNVLARFSSTYDCGDALWPMLAENGARSLGLETGRLVPGAPADFVAVDLSHPTLLGVDADSLLSSLVFAGTPACVRDVFVDGQRVVTGGKHPAQDEICARYLEVRRAVS